MVENCGHLYAGERFDSKLSQRAGEWLQPVGGIVVCEGGKTHACLSHRLGQLFRGQCAVTM